MPIQIYRATDRIPFKIGDSVFYLSPLTYQQKIDFSSAQSSESGDVQVNVLDGAFKAIKFSVKDISGIEYADGKPYKLQFKEGVLTDECVGDLLNMDATNKLIMCCASVCRSQYTDVTDPTTGEPIEGIEVLPVNSKRGVKKKA